MTLLLLSLGLVLLLAGAEALVRGASRLAAAMGITPLVIGLTVVAFGTSAPEMAVSTMSALDGQGDLALGNVVGSNVFNVLFILGLSALIMPLVVSAQLVRLDVPLMIAASLAVIGLALDGRLGRIDGVLLFAGILAYTGYLFLRSRRERASVGHEGHADGGHWAVQLAWIVGALVLLVMGSRWLVQGAVELARQLGVSEMVIGLTIVAAGTSLPELVTSVVASLRGERDIAVGNVVGSNLFNLLAVLGLSALVAPDGIAVPESALEFDLPVMLAVAVACLPVFFTGHLIARWEGFLFLAYYLAYASYLVLVATEHALLPAFGAAMMLFVLPLTVVTLGIVWARALRERASR